MNSLAERLDKIKVIVNEDSFYNQQSLGGELNFHIFDYEPKDELIIRKFIKTFVENNSYANSKIRPVAFDLFEMILDILNSRKAGSNTILDLSIQKEEKEGVDKLIKAISGILKPESFIKIIQEQIQDKNLVILYGVGKAYPIIRSHTVLNNLHAVLDNIPVIMFYPGQYDQKELNLFCGSTFEGLKDDNYYRAFRL